MFIVMIFWRVITLYILRVFNWKENEKQIRSTIKLSRLHAFTISEIANKVVAESLTHIAPESELLKWRK